MIGTRLRRNGILLNNRDAWTNGSFAADWASEVLALPGIGVKHWVLLRNTARSLPLFE